MQEEIQGVEALRVLSPEGLGDLLRAHRSLSLAHDLKNRLTFLAEAVVFRAPEQGPAPGGGVGSGRVPPVVCETGVEDGEGALGRAALPPHDSNPIAPRRQARAAADEIRHILDVAQFVAMMNDDNRQA